jgi:hypothetical protein
MGETVEVMAQPASSPPYPQGPSSPAKAPKPGGMVGIWIGIALILIGIIGGIALIASGASSFADGLNDVQRVGIESGGTVDLDETGTYSVFVERYVPGSGTSFNTSSSGGFVPDVQVSITDPNGNPAPVRPATGSETYTVDEYEGTRIGKFEADQPGIYTVRVEGGSAVANYDSIAVGKGLHLDGIVAILIGVFGGGALVLLGIILVIVFAVKRSRKKKRLASEANPYGSGMPGAPGGWPAAPAYGGGYPPNAGYGAPAAPWQPPAGAPGWVPPPATPGSVVGSPTPPAAPPAQPWQPPEPPPSAPAPDAPPPGAPTWDPPPPPAPAQEPPRWEPPAPPAGTDEPEP